MPFALYRDRLLPRPFWETINKAGGRRIVGRPGETLTQACRRQIIRGSRESPGEKRPR